MKVTVGQGEKGDGYGRGVGKGGEKKMGRWPSSYDDELGSYCVVFPKNGLSAAAYLPLARSKRSRGARIYLSVMFVAWDGRKFPRSSLRGNIRRVHDFTGVAQGVLSEAHPRARLKIMITAALLTL